MARVHHICHFPRFWLVASVLLASACARKTAAPPPSAPSPTEVSIPAPVAPPAAKKGLASPTSDPATVALANAALACTWRPDCRGRGCPQPELPLQPDESCAGIKAWRAAKLTADPASQATLINMLEDSDVRVRLLGAWPLCFGGHGTWASEPTLARRVLAAAAAETQEGNQITALACSVGAISYDATGLWAEAKPVIDGQTTGTFKDTVLRGISQTNAANQAIWEWALANAKAGNGSGASYLARFHKARQDEVCRVIGELMIERPNAGYPAQELTYEGNGCAGSVEAALAATEAFVHARAVQDWAWGDAAENILANRTATAAQKARAKEVLAAIARDTRAQGVFRAGALTRLHKADKAAGATLAASLAGDKNQDVAGAVKAIGGGK